MAEQPPAGPTVPELLEQWNRLWAEGGYEERDLQTTGDAMAAKLRELQEQLRLAVVDAANMEAERNDAEQRAEAAEKKVKELEEEMNTQLGGSFVK